MRRTAVLRTGAAVAAAASLSGCIVAAFPVVAGVMGARQVLEKRAAARAADEEPVDTPLATASLARAAAARAATAPGTAAAEPVRVSGDTDRFTAVRLDATELPAPKSVGLASSALGPAQPSATAFGGDSGFADFAAAALRRQREVAGSPTGDGAILVRDVSLSAPRFRRCGGTAPAVLIDLDEGARTPSRPIRAAPDLADALRPLRDRKIAVLWLTDLTATPAELRTDLTAAALWGEGDVVLSRSAPDDRKQERRQAAAATHCVLAVAGGDRADADELYDYLRAPDAAALLEANWGSRWFRTAGPVAVSPNPQDP